jgi:hypothetical protein
VIAKTNFGSIKLKDLRHAEQELKLINQIAPIYQRILGIEDSTHWVLLTRQAERMGLLGDQQDGESWVPQLANDEVSFRRLMDLERQYGSFASQILGMEAQQIAQQAETMANQISNSAVALTREAQLQPQDFGITLAKLRAVERMSRLYTNAATYSDRQAINEFRRDFDALVVSGVVIPAETGVADVPEPTPEHIKIQFETFREIKRGSGPGDFGYRLPPQVRLEWLRMSRQAISNAVVIDPIAANKHWQLNRTKYPADFATDQARVESDLRNEKIQKMLNIADRVISDRVRASLTRLPIDGTYRRLPENWDQDGPKLEALSDEIVNAIKASEGVTIPRPGVERPMTEWTPLPDMGKLSGIGTAFSRIGQRSFPFTSLVGLVRELAPQPNLDLQARVPFTAMVLENQEGDHFYFTILDVKPEAAPQTVDEVKDQVVNDIRLSESFERLKASLEVHKLAVLNTDLKTLASTFRKPGGAENETLQVFEKASVTRSGVNVSDPAIRSQLDSDEFRSAVFAAGGTLDPKFVPGPENAAARTVAIALPKSMCVALVQITGVKPIVIEDLRSANPLVAVQRGREELEMVRRKAGLPNALDLATLEESAGVTYVGGAKSKKEDADTKSAA